MCHLTPTQFERCGCTQNVWRYCDDVGFPRVATRGNIPNCQHLENQPAQTVDNCCSFECCVSDVEKHQDCVRKYEVVLLVAPGARYGLEYSQSATPGADSAQRISDMNNSRLAQNYSLQRAMRHLDYCSSAIKPGLGSTIGFLTDAVLELGVQSRAHPMTLDDQRSRIWDAFAPEIAQGILRAVRRHTNGQHDVVPLMRQALAIVNEENLVQSRTIARLMFFTIPQAFGDSLQPVEHTAPVPNFDGDDDDKKSKRLTLELYKAKTASPHFEWQRVLNSNPVQQYRAHYLRRAVTLDNFGVLGV